MPSKKKTDYRALLARRQSAIARKEIGYEKRKPSEEELRLAEEAVRAGRVTKCPPARHRPR
jgi:hypothetical protein